MQRVSGALFGCPTAIGLVVKKIELRGTQMDRPLYPIMLGHGAVSQARFAVPVKENATVDRDLSARPTMAFREI